MRMGLFNFWTKKDKNREDCKEYWPGGRMLQVHLTYDVTNLVVKYFGRYGVTSSFSVVAIREIKYNKVSNTHASLSILGDDECLAVFDILSNSINHSIIRWLHHEFANTHQLREHTIIFPHIAESDNITIDTRIDTNQCDMTTRMDYSLPEGIQVIDSSLDFSSLLRQLKQLHDEGVITDEEFESKKQDILSRL